MDFVNTNAHQPWNTFLMVDVMVDVSVSNNL